MLDDLETVMKRYFEHYESKIAELFSMRTEIDKNNELRCKINAIEVESLVDKKEAREDSQPCKKKSTGTNRGKEFSKNYLMQLL